MELPVSVEQAPRCLRKRSWLRFPGWLNRTVSQTARYRCDVSSELCCQGAKRRRWIPSHLGTILPNIVKILIPFGYSCSQPQSETEHQCVVCYVNCDITVAFIKASGADEGRLVCFVTFPHENIMFGIEKPCHEIGELVNVKIMKPM